MTASQGNIDTPPSNIERVSMLPQQVITAVCYKGVVFQVWWRFYV